MNCDIYIGVITEKIRFQAVFKAFAQMPLLRAVLPCVAF